MTTVYADTDFFAAILKETDWLKEPALKLLATYRDDLRASVACVLELLLLSKKFDLNAERLINDIYLIAQVDDVEHGRAMLAAGYMDEYGLNPFDAMHAASAGTHPLISSDHVFDRLEIKRIPLRP
jgi:predicted nucleic acid-binding protein